MGGINHQQLVVYYCYTNCKLSQSDFQQDDGWYMLVSIDKFLYWKNSLEPMNTRQTLKLKLAPWHLAGSREAESWWTRQGPHGPQGPQGPQGSVNEGRNSGDIWGCGTAL